MAAVLSFGVLVASSADAQRYRDEIYIRNGSAQSLIFDLRLDNGNWQEHRIAPYDNVTYFCTGGCRVSNFFVRIRTTNGCVREYRIPPFERNVIQWDEGTQCWDFFRD